MFGRKQKGRIEAENCDHTSKGQKAHKAENCSLFFKRPK